VTYWWGRRPLGFNSNARLEVFKGFFFTLTFYDSYDSRPPSKSGVTNEIPRRRPATIMQEQSRKPGALCSGTIARSTRSCKNMVPLPKARRQPISILSATPSFRLGQHISFECFGGQFPGGSMLKEAAVFDRIRGWLVAMKKRSVHGYDE
jgi:hypothetical protein